MDWVIIRVGATKCVANNSIMDGVECVTFCRCNDEDKQTANEQNMSTDGSPLVPPALEALLHRPFQRIVVFSGAGMSADSNVPTFRSGNNGLWSAFDPSELATPEAWSRDKATVWGWYEWRRGLVSTALPNAGHLAVAEMQRRFGATVITQNVDDLHERGGAKDVLHLHGSLFAARCAVCGRPHALGAAPQEAQLKRQPPRCLHCPGHVRPGVVWFGEPLDPEVVSLSEQRITACDLLLIVGTSGVVYPAAGMVDRASAGATVVEINPLSGSISKQIGFRWQTTAARGLPSLLSALNTAH